MAGAQGVDRLALGVVGHLPGEELDIGAAHPDAMHVHDDLPRAWHGDLDLLDPGHAGAAQYEGPHRRRAGGTTEAEGRSDPAGTTRMGTPPPGMGHGRQAMALFHNVDIRRNSENTPRERSPRARRCGRPDRSAVPGWSGHQ